MSLKRQRYSQTERQTEIQTETDREADREAGRQTVGRQTQIDRFLLKRFCCTDQQNLLIYMAIVFCIYTYLQESLNHYIKLESINLKLLLQRCTW